jgi:hypothetical protein
VSSEGLREALGFLQRVADANPDIDPQTTPWFIATNSLIMEIANREGTDINAVVESLR